MEYMCDLGDDDEDHTIVAPGFLAAINLSCLRLQYTMSVINAINKAKAMAIAYRGCASTFEAGGEETAIEGAGVAMGSMNGMWDADRDGVSVHKDGDDVGT